MSRCYILGSGFSKICGLPLAGELAAEVFRHSYPDNFWQPRTRKAYLEYLKDIYPNCDFESNWPDFEDLITVLDEWEDYHCSYEGTGISGNLLNVAHLKNVLLKHLGLLLCERTAAASSSGQMDVIKDFVRSVCEEKSTIISFNWDLLVEIAAKELNIGISYGSETNDGLEIAKPHGSLNLAELETERFTEMQDSINIHSLQIDWKTDSTVVIRTSDPIDAANRIIHPFESALLVEPTARKSYLSGWIQLQWRRALDFLRRVEELVVIGYSLPNTDFRPRILLQLTTFCRQDQPRLKLVDPRATEVANDYRQFLSMPIEAIEGSWEEWFARQ